jgi:hypothetical protein
MDGEYGVLERLANDDSNETDPELKLSNENARLVGLALSNSSHVKSLLLKISNNLTDMEACKAVLEYIHQRTTILGIAVKSEHRDQTVNSLIAGHFVEAVARSSSIIYVQFCRCELSSASFCAFTRQARTVTSLEMRNCTLVLPNQETARVLEAAIGANTTINLWIFRRLNGDALAVVLRGLAKRRRRAKILHLDNFDALEDFHALGCSREIQALLESANSSPEFLGLCGFGEFDQQSFGPIATGLRNSKTLTRLGLFSSFSSELRDSSMNESATNMLESIFSSGEGPPELNLCFGNQPIEGPPELHLRFGNEWAERLRFAKPTGTMLGNILRQKKSCLRSLMLVSYRPGREQATTFLSALQVSDSLEKLELSYIDPSFCQQFLGILPMNRSLRVIKIRIEAPTELLPPGLVDQILDAFKRNMSSEHSGIKGETRILRARQRKTLKSYGRRNVGLWKIRESPRSVPVSFLPKIFGRALECDTGPNFVFRSLLAWDTLESDKGNKDGSEVEDLKFLTEKHVEMEKAEAAQRIGKEEKLKKPASEIKKAQEEAKAEKARAPAGGFPGGMPGGGMPAGMEDQVGNRHGDDREGSRDGTDTSVVQDRLLSLSLSDGAVHVDPHQGGARPNGPRRHGGPAAAMMSDPELVAAVQNPKVQAALQNPAEIPEMMNDPEVGPILQKLMSKMAGGIPGAGAPPAEDSG